MSCHATFVTQAPSNFPLSTSFPFMKHHFCDTIISLLVNHMVLTFSLTSTYTDSRSVVIV